MADEWPPFAVEPGVMAVLEALWTCGHGAYLVGGGVRDALLGLPVADWDVATDARPERILEIFPGGIYENRFGTVQARGVEITTFRREHRYADHRRPDSVTFSSDVYEDLARRDLTINAIAWGRQGAGLPVRVVDPADGQGDLSARLVRAVGDPARRFEEDALRLLRAVRIAARLDFAIEPVTLAAMAAHAVDIRWVSEERVGDEIRRVLVARRPSTAFRIMATTGILAATIPESMPSDRPGGEAALAASLAALDAISATVPGNERLAFAALLGHAGPTGARDALERLRVAHREVDAVSALIAAAAFEGMTARPSEEHSDGDIRRYLANIPADLVDDLMTLRRAQAGTRGEGALEDELTFQERVKGLRGERPALSLAELSIDGHDLQATLGVPEGPIVGVILERLLADVIEEPSLNQRITLLTRASLHLQDEAERAGGGTATASEE